MCRINALWHQHCCSLAVYGFGEGDRAGNLLNFDRLEEPGYAEYFEEAARRITIARKKLSELEIAESAPTPAIEE